MGFIIIEMEEYCPKRRMEQQEEAQWWQFTKSKCFCLKFAPKSASWDHLRASSCCLINRVSSCVWYPCCSPGTFLSAWQSPAVVTSRWCTFNHSPATRFMAWPSSWWLQVPGCPLHLQLVPSARNFLSSFEEHVCYLGGSLGNWGIPGSWCLCDPWPYNGQLMFYWQECLSKVFSSPVFNSSPILLFCLNAIILILKESQNASSMQFYMTQQQGNSFCCQQVLSLQDRYSQNEEMTFLESK